MKYKEILFFKSNLNFLAIYDNPLDIKIVGSTQTGKIIKQLKKKLVTVRK